jgi:exodeoxyribonuclease V alpha subunit
MQSKIKQFGLNTTASGTLHKVIYSSFPYIEKPPSKKNNKNDSHTPSDSFCDNINRIHYDSYSDSDSDSDYESEYDTSEMETIDTMFIDEVSMVDIFMFIHIISWAKKFRFQLILIGDKNQLPSIGPGKLLNSIIESGLFNDNIIQLTEICRQDNGALLDAIKKMATGNDYKNIIQQRDFDNKTLLFRPIRFYKDGNIIKEESILKLIDDYNLNTNNCKFLCYNSDPTKPINVTAINSILQKKFNADSSVTIKSPSWKTLSFKENDHIILKHNERQKSKIFDKKSNKYSDKKEYRANGDEAVILKYNEEKQTVTIWYKDTDDSETIISIKDLYELYDLSYALTIHKSQGSQYENIIFLIDNIYNLTKPVIFTGISRAKERCFIISDMTDFIEVQKKEEEKISVFLEEFLETIIE